MGINRKLPNGGLKSVIPRACAVGWGRHPHHRYDNSERMVVAAIPIAILQTVKKLSTIEFLQFLPKIFPYDHIDSYLTSVERGNCLYDHC